MNVKTLQCMQIERHLERIFITMKQCEKTGKQTMFCHKRNSALEIGWVLGNGRSVYLHFIRLSARTYAVKRVKNYIYREQLWTTNKKPCETTKYKGISYTLKIYCACGVNIFDHLILRINSKIYFSLKQDFTSFLTVHS